MAGIDERDLRPAFVQLKQRGERIGGIAKPFIVDRPTFSETVKRCEEIGSDSNRAVKTQHTCRFPMEQSQAMWLTLMNEKAGVLSRHYRATPYYSDNEEYYRTTSGGGGTTLPVYGYGYAKLKCWCCCSFTSSDVYRRENHLRLSFKCPIGPPGARGSIGDAGENGSRGQPGSNGQDYPSILQPRRFEYGIQSTFADYLPASLRLPVDCGTCPVGEPGVQGVPGKLGGRGVAGVPGRNGIHGIPGGVGPTGLTGEIGLRGRSGRSGLPGVRGLDGVKRALGASGPKGELGVTGLRGARGVSGQTGSMGAFGPRGNEGPRGIKGQRGMDGADGGQGSPGQPGKDALYCKCPSRQRAQQQMSDTYYYSGPGSSGGEGSSSSNSYLDMPNSNPYRMGERAVPADRYASKQTQHNYYSPPANPIQGATSSYLKTIHVADDLSTQQIHRDYLLNSKPMTSSSTSVGPPAQTPPGHNGISRVVHEAPGLPSENADTADSNQQHLFATTEVEEFPFGVDDIDILKKRRRSH